MITNLTTGEVIAAKVEYCDTFWTRLRGLMFRPSLDDDTAILLVEKWESRVNTAIHMLFVGFDIAVLWLDSHKVVVDKLLARPWRPYYASEEPAKYVIESSPKMLEQVNVGDQLAWEVRE